jgi:hypothetical protein
MSIDPETLRLQQLQLMGITSYFPRYLLPGALPSRIIELDTPSAADEEKVTLTAEIGESLDIRRNVAVHTEAKRDRKLQVTEPAVARPSLTQPGHATKETPQEENPGDAANLHLLLIPVDANLCILNQLPVLAKSQLPERQQKLLDNILLFLGVRAAVYDSVRTFRWPLPGISAIGTGNAGKSSLMHFLEQFSQEHPFSNLLVMGEQGADWLTEAGQLRADTSPQVPWQMLHTYSLDQILTAPSIKREVWQHLLPLKARLKQA